MSSLADDSPRIPKVPHKAWKLMPHREIVARLELFESYAFSSYDKAKLFLRRNASHCYHPSIHSKAIVNLTDGSSPGSSSARQAICVMKSGGNGNDKESRSWHVPSREIKVELTNPFLD